MLVQETVTGSKTEYNGLSLSVKDMYAVLMWQISIFLIIPIGPESILQNGLGLMIRHRRLGLWKFCGFLCKLVCFFVSSYTNMCWDPLEYNCVACRQLGNTRRCCVSFSDGPVDIACSADSESVRNTMFCCLVSF